MRKLILALALVGCTSDQKADARTALDVSMCVQAIVLEHIDDNLKDPVVASQLGLEIVSRCYPKPVGDAGAP